MKYYFQRLLTLLSVATLIIFASCDKDNGGTTDEEFVVTYALSTSSPSNVGAGFNVTVTYDDATYKKGTVTVSGHDNTAHPMPSGFGNGSVDADANVFGGADFSVVNTSKTQISLEWTEPVPASARVAETPTTYNYTLSAQ